MVVDFVVFVDVRELFAFDRSIVCAVEETVAKPLCAREFSPYDVVGNVLASFEVYDENLFPVATFARDSVGEIFAIVRETDFVESYSAIFG